MVRYISSGWLVSPARGGYLRKGGRLQWQDVLRSLQQREGLPLYIGGRFALAMHGHEHYLRLGEGDFDLLAQKFRELHGERVEVYGVPKLTAIFLSMPRASSYRSRAICS
ncbi:AbiEi antitoxin N-terminal domain-containing protein [Chromohalobacter canadensis]|nr:AbiEi antitoxin N-terminal domain-containing protein [Chromohalobacter canadensis]